MLHLEYLLQLSSSYGIAEDQNADCDSDRDHRVWSLLEFALDGEAGTALAVALLADLF
jgi:hypothetical protein